MFYINNSSIENFARGATQLPTVLRSFFKSSTKLDANVQIQVAKEKNRSLSRQVTQPIHLNKQSPLSSSIDTPLLPDRTTRADTQLKEENTGLDLKEAICTWPNNKRVYYTELKFLGEGDSKKCYYVKLNKNNSSEEQYALLKYLYPEKNETGIYKSYERIHYIAQQEIKNLKKLQGKPGVIQIHSALKTPDEKILILVKHYNQGTLKSFLENEKYVSQSEKNLIVHQLLLGMDSLRKNNILTEIKADNILIERLPNGNLNAVICDFETPPPTHKNQFSRDLRSMLTLIRSSIYKNDLNLEECKFIDDAIALENRSLEEGSQGNDIQNLLRHWKNKFSPA